MLGHFNLQLIFDHFDLFRHGLWWTCLLSAMGWISAVSLGLTACALKLGPVRALQRSAGFYIESIRSTPLLVQLYFLYFGLPEIGIVLPEVVVGVIALGLNSGAYMAEIFRAGILKVAPGQIEAARSSGLSAWRIQRHVVLPQAVAYAAMPLMSQTIVLVKDSSLLSLISITELAFAAEDFYSRFFSPLEGYVTIALLYFAIYLILNSASDHWARKIKTITGTG
ncbi:MAG: hypothetical protein AUK55_14450 [Syntrophobacteraceae bacterium CG2_30_61_12]|nr:MAG: hypothetical protein AUK55_14450 [Syntrophobacteraceae bacterium CG2_30_61_12]